MMASAAASGGDSPAAIDLDHVGNNDVNKAEAEEEVVGHEISLDPNEHDDELEVADGNASASRDSPLNVITDKMMDLVKEEREYIHKLTRLDLVGISTRQATSRWNDILEKKSSSPGSKNDSAFPSAPPVFTDVRNWRCMTISVIMTILFYTLCVGSIFVIVFIFFWWWFVWRPENGQSLVNETTVLF
jgi:hypothetical protein